MRLEELIGGWTGDHGTASTLSLGAGRPWACGDIRLILRLRIDDLSDFTEYSWAGVRTERREPGERGEPGVLISYHCSVTPTVTFML